jgi:serine/threonine-protein kinase
MWHWVRRRPAIAGALVLVPLTVLLVTVLALQLRPGEIPPEDPDVALKQIEASLANGEKVELIGQTGAPRWYRTVVGGNHTRTSLAKDGTFTIDPWDEDLTLVELVRDPHRQSYTITAQVRQEESDQLGDVGIYCCRYEYLARPRTAAVMLIYLTYSDAYDAAEESKLHPMLKPVSGNAANFTFYWYSHRQGKLIADDNVDDHSRKNVFKAAGPNAMRWRTLVLKVAPDGIEGNWDKATNIGKILAAGLAAQADKSLRAKGVGGPDDPKLQQLYPGFPQRGGIGLFVRRSSASFCNVTIE